MKKIIALILLVLLFSCKHEIAKLKETDFRWIPYKGDEVLKFKSNNGDADTLFLLGSRRDTTPADQLDAFPTYYESYSIFYRNSRDAKNYGRILMHLVAPDQGVTKISIDIITKNGWFYGGNFLQLAKLDTMRVHTITANSKKYDDIILLMPDNKEYFDRSNFITKVYWSKSKGLVRYDKKNNEYWELTNN